MLTITELEARTIKAETVYNAVGGDLKALENRYSQGIKAGVDIDLSARISELRTRHQLAGATWQAAKAELQKAREFYSGPTYKKILKDAGDLEKRFDAIASDLISNVYQINNGLGMAREIARALKRLGRENDLDFPDLFQTKLGKILELLEELTSRSMESLKLYRSTTKRPKV